MKIKTSIVSYSNSKPFLHGLKEDEAILSQMEIYEDVPAIAAQKLIEGTVDLALVPVAALIDLPNFQIVSDYCIGATKEVYSVALFSNYPIEKIEGILLDSQSRTSNMLCRVLVEEHWQENIPFYQKEDEVPEHARIAKVIIGDRAFGLENEYRYKYDLSSAWYEMTGKPFVFAVWVSRDELSEDFIVQFNDTLANGLQERDAVIQSLAENKKMYSFYMQYLYDYIEYDFSIPKQKGLRLFLDKLGVEV